MTTTLAVALSFVGSMAATLVVMNVVDHYDRRERQRDAELSKRPADDAEQNHRAQEPKIEPGHQHDVQPFPVAFFLRPKIERLAKQ